MQTCSPADHTERARPLLGTRVAIRVAGMDARQAHTQIDKAFGCIAEIHRLMSFHEAGSDLSRLNREAASSAVRVNPKTWQVLAAAQAFSNASAGCFDVTIAKDLVIAGKLPPVAGIAIPATGADWRDIELLPDHLVHFTRPLWIDLGGIAKGYAVDCAIHLLRDAGVEQACVNAGGDLRVFGPAAERVHLLSAMTGQQIPVLEISDAAVASSGADGMHWNARMRAPVNGDAQVSVVAADCMTADALTKIVLADPGLAESLLPQYRAVAYLYDPHHSHSSGWRTLGAPAELSC